MESKELKEKLDLYDKIITSCMVNTYSFAKENNKIIMQNFWPRPDYLFAFQVANLVWVTNPNMTIYMNMPLIKYLIFKIKNRKIKMRWIRKCKEVDHAMNIEEMLDYVAKAYKVDYSIFEDIYDIYWSKKKGEMDV